MDKILFLQKCYGNLPKQDTCEWLNSRKYLFGGSEIGTVLKNSFRNREKALNLISKKAKNVQSIQNLFMWWGKVFEQVAKMYLKYVREITIYEFGFIPCSNLPIGFSPDGVFVDPDAPDKLWLLEIKCPFLRNVNDHTGVDPIYKEQVQCGMHILPCTQTSFLQFKFRRCFRDQLDKVTEYDRKLHKEGKNILPQKEIFKGYLYWKGENELKEGKEQRMPDVMLCDFMNAHYYDEVCKNYKTGTIMFFKCFFVKEHQIPRNNNWRFKNEDLIWQRHNLLLNEMKRNEEENNQNTDVEMS